VKYPRIFHTCAILMLAAALGGCSSGSGPTTPLTMLDSTPPPAPASLALDYDAASAHYVLTWDPSAAPDVAGYEVHLYSSDPSTASDYVMIGSPAGAGFTMPDPENPADWSVRVRARDNAGNLSPFSSLTSQPVIPPNPTGMGGGGGNGDHERTRRLPE
jgi:hypothetical protein